MIDPVSGAPPWHPPAAVPGSAPAFEPAFEDDPEPAAPPPLGAAGPPAGAADVAARYRSAAEAAEDSALLRTDVWA